MGFCPDFDMFAPSRADHKCVWSTLVRGKIVGEIEWRSWWWCWLRTSTTVVPPCSPVMHGVAEEQEEGRQWSWST